MNYRRGSAAVIAVTFTLGLSVPAFADDETTPVAGHTDSEAANPTVQGVLINATVNSPDDPSGASATVTSSNSFLGSDPNALTMSPLSAGSSAGFSTLGLTAGQVNYTPPEATGSDPNGDSFGGSYSKAGGFDCVKHTKAGSRLYAFKPLHIDKSDSDWDVHYLDHPYSLTKARYVNGGYSTQLVECVIGGAQNHHSITQRMASTYGEVSIGSTANQRIGSNWGTAVDKGASSSSLSFSATAEVASISGSIPVSTGGSETGSIGSGDPCGAIGGNAGNQTNAGWKMTYPGYGTSDFKGNVGQALYEWYVPNKTSFQIRFRACHQARY